MAEQPTELRRINWSECFSFTHIFRAFRMAIHPSKLGLAFAGLVLMALWGTILDAVWSSKCQPVADEVNAFWQVPDVDAWRESVKPAQARQLSQAYASMGQSVPEDLAANFAEDPNDVIAEAIEDLEESYDKAIKDVDKAEEGKLDKETRRSRIAAIARDRSAIHAQLESLGPKGVCRSFCTFEMSVVRQMVDAARGLNFTGRIGEVMSGRSGPFDEPVPREAAVGGGPILNLGSLVPLRYESVRTGPEGIGVLSCVVLMLRGGQWLVMEHWLFAILFLLPSLAIWALFGGAICRMAALSVARDERISPQDALSFARRKFLGFLTAPLLPIGLIAVIGVCLFIGGLFMAIPYVGDIVGGVGMGLALLGGFVMALVAVGAIGGGGLMWPTIAVEGSDSFDAMSRSYSYVYAKPWRAGFYAAVAMVYGALCYLFARFFVLVLLKATRFFVALGVRVFPTYRPGTGVEGGKKMDALWPHPTFEDLVPAAPPFGVESWGGSAGAFLVEIWVWIVAGLLCGFLLSFFFSASTIIYYLLRWKVDATDMEDVYLEEEQEEGEAAPPTESAPEAPSATPGPEAKPAPPTPSPPPEEPSPTSEPTDEPAAPDEDDDTAEDDES